MNDKKQVFFVWNYLAWGGAQIYFLSIARQANRNDWNFTVVLPRDSKPEITKYFDEHGIGYEYLDAHTDLSDARTIFEKVARQAKRLRAEAAAFRFLAKNADEKTIVHIESAPWQSWILLWALTRKTNVFVTIHNALPAEITGWRRKVWSARLNFLLKLKRFHVFAANRHAIESLKKLTAAEHHDKFVLTRAAINPSEIERVFETPTPKLELLKKFGLPEKKFIVLCVGQFIDRKGRWIFLEAAKIRNGGGDDVHFVWVAPSAPDAADAAKIANFDLRNFTFVLSDDIGKNRHDVLEFFKIADVFTLPSLWEGLPIAILEAMALEIPTISTDLNAIPEAIVNNVTGLLVPTGDADRLAEAILSLRESGNDRRRLAKAGRKFVIENFDERKWAAEALENYEKCLKK